jgi:hypothetical protein
LDKSQGETVARYARHHGTAVARFAEVASTMRAAPLPKCADGQLEIESDVDEISQPALRTKGSSGSSLRRNRNQAIL